MSIQKHNYIDHIVPLVPSLYLDREDLNHGVEEELSYKVLAHYLRLVSTASSVFPVSGLSAAELQARFVPANKLTRVTSRDINDYVFAPLGLEIADYTASSDFETVLTSSVLSAIILNGEDQYRSDAFRLWVSGDGNSVPGVSGLYPEVSTVSLAHNKLVEKLGLLYFLNCSGPVPLAGRDADHVELSSLSVSSLWIDKIFKGKTVTEEDCLATYFEYVWKNREFGYSTLAAHNVMPAEFLSSTAEVSSQTYLSGTQLLDAYKSSLGLWTNTNMDDSPFVKDSVEVFLSSTLIPTRFANSGSLSKFLRALGYASYDLNHVVDSLQDLIDIDKCPAQFLDYLAAMVGWKLIGSDSTEWRQQLRNAVNAYRMKGTASGLDAVVEYIFDRDVFYPTSGLTETWESYLPNILYYLVKTESFLTSATGEEARQWTTWWKNNSSVTVNYDPNDMDNNCRFVVDFLLEYLDNQHKLIHINGKHWKQSDMWKEIQENPNSAKGFEHRGKTVKIPPWEKDRFYSDSYITLDALSSVSSILATDKLHGGLSMTEEAAAYVVDFCKENLGLDQIPPMPGDRQRFKFLTSALAVPPNVSSLPLRSGTFEDATNLSDYWNRKSSVMVLDINAEDVNMSQKDYSKLTLENLRMLHQVFRDFVPLRVMINTVITKSMDDGGGGPWGTGGYLPSGSLCLQGDYSKQDPATNIINDVFTSGFMMPVRDGQVSAGDWQEGRYLPDPSATFWNTTADLGILARFASRARNLRYNLPGRFFSRNGRNSPHSMDFFFNYTWGDTLTTAVSAGEHGYLFSSMITSSFVPKGWNFSSQSYLPVSSRIFDASNQIKAGRAGYTHPRYLPTETGIGASASYPFRAPVKYAMDCSGWGAEERHRLFEINRQIVDIIIKRYKATNDRALLNFNHEDLLNREFGIGVHTLFRKYKNQFMNRLDDSGYSAMYHIYGPLLENGDVPVRGSLLDGTADTAQSHTPGHAPGVDDNMATRPEYKNIIGGHGIHANTFYNSSGVKQLIESFGLISEEGLHSWKSDFDRLSTKPQYSNASLLSGVQVTTSVAGKSFAVLNDEYTTFRQTRQDTDCISLLSRGGNRSYEDCLKFRFPLLQNKEFISNPRFKAADPSQLATVRPSREDVKNWELLDYARAPGWFTVLGGSLGTITVWKDTSGNNNLVAKSYTNTPTWKNDMSPNIATPIEPLIGAGSIDKVPVQPIRKGFIPGKTYTASLECSSDGAGLKWSMGILNTTSNKIWDGASFIAGGLAEAQHATTVNGALDGFETLSNNFTIPLNASPSDNYQMWLSFAGGAPGYRSMLRKFSVKEKMSVESNALTPDSKYEFVIEALATGFQFPGIDFDYKTGILGARVCTDINNADDSTEGSQYVYNFITKRWDVLDAAAYSRDLTEGYLGFGSRDDMGAPAGQFQYSETGLPYSGKYHRHDKAGTVTHMTGATHSARESKKLTPIGAHHYVLEPRNDCALFSLPAGTKKPQKLTFQFHTLNQRGPLGGDGKRLGGTHKNIHNEDTGYYVEFFQVKPPWTSPETKETRIDVHKVYGKDLELYKLTTAEFNPTDYDREDTEVILRFFNSIVDDYKVNSRYYPDSSPYVGTGGGGRSEMLVPLGGRFIKADDAGSQFGVGGGGRTATVYEI